MSDAKTSNVTSFTALLLIGVLICGLMWAYDHFKNRPSAASPQAGPVDTSSSRVTDMLRDEQVIVDETLAVDAGGHQMRGFSLPSDRKIRVVAEGVSHTAKGFSVNCVNPDQWEKLTAGKQFTCALGLSGEKVQAFDKIERLPAGDWGIVISNTENMLNTMQVRLRIIADPK